jgi:hypothetical protein
MKHAQISQNMFEIKKSCKYEYFCWKHVQIAQNMFEIKKAVNMNILLLKARSDFSKHTVHTV